MTVEWTLCTCRHNDLIIMLTYVLKFLLGTIKILLIFLIAISRTNLFTETIRSFNFFYFSNLHTFLKISEAQSIFFETFTLDTWCCKQCFFEVSLWLIIWNNSKFSDKDGSWRDGNLCVTKPWLTICISIYSICTTFFCDFSIGPF